MAFELASKDLGMDDCDFVAKGDTMEEFMANAVEHGKAVHGYTEEQLNDPKMGEQIQAKIRQV